MGLLEDISKRSGVEFRPAAISEIEQLRSIGMPEDALAFYRDSEPAKCAEINRVRLWPIFNVLEENKNYVPGHSLQPLGFVVFATTIFGDTFCFDTNTAPTSETAPVVLMAHDVEWDELKPDEILELAKPVASSLDAFLQKYAAGTLELTPLYPAANS
jgi:hypothetical protein